MNHQKRLKKLFVALCIVAALIILFLPFIVEKVYYTNPPVEFFYLNYDAKDILMYYGSVLSFLGTVILGALTLHQNKKAQEKSDEVNRLQLELQRKSMAMAEAQYKKSADNSVSAPKFEITLRGYNGTYANLKLSLKNVTSQMVSCLTPIKFIVTDSKGQEITQADKMSFKPRSLSSGESAELEANTPELLIRDVRGITYLLNVSLSFSFSCEDEKENVHYYRATAEVDSTKNFYKDLWHIEKVG